MAMFVFSRPFTGFHRPSAYFGFKWQTSGPAVLGHLGAVSLVLTTGQLNRELDLFCRGTQTFLPSCHRGQSAPPAGFLRSFLSGHTYTCLLLCDSDHYIPLTQGNFCSCRSLLSLSSCFQCLHSFIQRESRSLLVGGDMCCVLHTHFSPLYMTLVNLPSLRGSLVSHRTLQLRCPCFTRF